MLTPDKAKLFSFYDIFNCSFFSFNTWMDVIGILCLHQKIHFKNSITEKRGFEIHKIQLLSLLSVNPTFFQLLLDY